MDRNCEGVSLLSFPRWSLSARRAWIEIIDYIIDYVNDAINGCNPDLDGKLDAELWVM